MSTACDSYKNEQQCRNDPNCLIWGLDGVQTFTKCMKKSECDENAGMQEFNNTCSCDNAGWNAQTKTCECGQHTTPPTIFSMTNVDGYYDCLPIGSCKNDTKYLVKNVPGNNYCMCVDNAIPDEQYIDDNDETYERCKCASGYVRSSDGKRCVIPPTPTPPQPAPSPSPSPSPSPNPSPNPNPTPNPNPGTTSCESITSQEQCINAPDCLIWRLDGNQTFKQCMKKTDCDTSKGMYDFGTECVCENAGWNVEEQKCQCGAKTTPPTILSMPIDEDGNRDCLPFGSCKNDTEYLVQNIPGTDTCQCIKNAVQTDKYVDGNGDTYERCKCANGYVVSKNGTRCVRSNSSGIPGFDTSDNQSGASPALIALVVSIIIGLLVAITALTIYVRKSLKQRSNNEQTQNLNEIY